MKKILLLLILILVPSCAQDKIVDLKSPCVSGKNGPCERIPVNSWWLGTGPVYS